MARQEDIRFSADADHAMRASLAIPESDRRRAALIVLHEILGLNDDIRRIAMRFADDGYVALAPDLFDGPGAKPLCIARTIAAVRRGEGAAFDHLEAARVFLAARHDVDESRIGIVGFCMGGGFATLYAARAPLAVAAPFYGDVPESAEALRGICPVVAGYGGRDRIFGPQGRRLEAHLNELGVPHDVVVYDDAGHSYMSPREGIVGLLGGLTPMSAGYHEAAAEDSWARMLAFFERYLG